MEIGSFRLDLMELANALAVLYGVWRAFDAHKRHRAKKEADSVSDSSEFTDPPSPPPSPSPGGTP